MNWVDNLRLGYAGTKEGFAQLIADANEYAKSIGQAGDLQMGNFADAIRAIELIQEKQQIAGTTAREAGKTIEGSVNAAKAAWTNFLTELGKDDGDVGARIDELIESIFGDGTDSNLGVVGNIAPRIVKIVDSVVDAIPMIIEKVTPYLEQIATKVQEFVNEHQEEINALGETLWNGLVQALMLSIELAFAALGQMFATLITTFPQWAPKLLEAAVMLFASIVQGIATAIPQVLESLTNLLGDLIRYVTGYDGSLLEAAQNLFHNIGDAVTNTREFIVTSVQEAVNAAITAVTEFFQQAFDVGANIVQGIVQGIQSAPQAVADALGGVVGGAVDGVKGFLGIASPSTLFAEIGSFTMEGFANGISNGGPSVLQSMQNIMQGLVDGTGVGRDDVVNVISALPQMMTSALGPAGWMLGDIGRYMMQGLANGISNSQNWVVDALWGGVWGAVDMVKGWLGIQSPSKLFAELGGYTMQGFAKGIDAEADAPEKAMLDAARAVYGAASGKIDFAAAASAAGIQGGYPMGGVSIVINDPVIRETADVDAIMDYIETQVRRRVGQWNPSLSMAMS